MSAAHLLALLMATLGVSGAAYAAIRLTSSAYAERVSRAEAEYRNDLLELDLPREWAGVAAVVQYLGAAVLGVLVLVTTRSVIAALVAAGLTSAAPPLYLRYLSGKRRDRLDRQLPDAIDVMANGARAGLSLAQTLRLVAERGSGPVKQEFQLIARSLDLGSDVDTALRAAARRVGQPNFSLMVSAVLMNRERGGDLPLLLNQIARSVRAISHAAERVQSETASVRFAARVMVGTIPALAAILYVMDPESVGALFGTLLGNAALVLVAVMATAGYRMIVRLGNPDI